MSEVPARSGALEREADGRRRVVIEAVTPEVDAGLWPAKRVLGDEVVVECDLVADGHDAIAGALLVRKAGAPAWREVRLEPLQNDRYRARFLAGEVGTYEYTIEAWPEAFATWRRGLTRKADAGQDVSLELLSGARLVSSAATRARGVAQRTLAEAAKVLGDAGLSPSERVAAALDPLLSDLAARHPDRAHASRYSRVLPLTVDPPRARSSAWYELFPRSTGAPGRHGTFRDAEARLPYVASMGFDVLYLPPIHPIGRSFRKGPNNTLQAGPHDPGSPWAIGAAEGGHKSVHPELGTLEDFRHFVGAARELGLEVALDIAFQASPDHPYVTSHPEWFPKRADGSIQYAENPPKKYQDVYPFDFDCDDWRALWAELLSIFLFWIEQGVTIFRVDNPHTKSLRFWAYCIAEVKARCPEAIFLAEAFTRPKLVYALAKAGFSQSYTYFTWRHTKRELVDYLTEITRPPVSEFFRPNFWPNTPDILPEHLQFGGRAAFQQRLVLAATLSASFGVYGPAFELMEHVARPGAEEYVDNEKYELKSWRLDDPDSLRDFIARVNKIRRENKAFQRNDRLAFHATDNDQLLAYSKRTDDRDDVVLVVVNLDVHHTHSGWIELDLAELGVDAKETYQVHDLLSDARYSWQGARAFVEIDPRVMPAHVFRLRRRVRSEHDFEYYL